MVGKKTIPIILGATEVAAETDPSEAIAGIFALLFALIPVAFGIIWLLLLVIGLTLAAVTIAGLIWSLLDLSKRKFPDSDTQLVWILVIVFGNLLGIIVYYLIVVRKNKYPKKEKTNQDQNASYGNSQNTRHQEDYGQEPGPSQQE